MCQKLILLSNEQSLSVYKVEKLIQDFDKMGIDCLHEKASLIVNGNTGSQGEELTSIGKLDIAGYIPFDNTLNIMGDHRPLNHNGVLESALKQYLGLSSAGERDTY